MESSTLQLGFDCVIYVASLSVRQSRQSEFVTPQTASALSFANVAWRPPRRHSHSPRNSKPDPQKEGGLSLLVPALALNASRHVAAATLQDIWSALRRLGGSRVDFLRANLDCSFGCTRLHIVQVQGSLARQFATAMPMHLYFSLLRIRSLPHMPHSVQVRKQFVHQDE